MFVLVDSDHSTWPGLPLLPNVAAKHFHVKTNVGSIALASQIRCLVLCSCQGFFCYAFLLKNAIRVCMTYLALPLNVVKTVILH